MQDKNKILAVDDNSINLAVMEELLGDQYNLITVSTGTDALRVAEEFQPDLILLDIMLEGVNGYEICQQVRQNSSLKHTKIIMVTAKAMESERLKGYQAGADDYLTKPFDSEDLLAKVYAQLEQEPVKATSENE